MPKYRRDGMPRITLDNIKRLEKHGCGWRVHIKRQRREYTEYFPDGWDGPFESLRGAIAWRDRQWEALGGPTHVPQKATRRSLTGILGVSYESQELPNGRVVENYRAFWTKADGGPGKRSFSVDKYGRDEALQLAMRARREGDAEAKRRRRGKLLDVLHTHQQLLSGKPPRPEARRKPRR